MPPDWDTSRLWESRNPLAAAELRGDDNATMISHHHRFVFVHVWKSGGMSVTAALNSVRRRNLFDHVDNLKTHLSPYCKKLGFQRDSNTDTTTRSILSKSSAGIGSMIISNSRL